MSDNGRPSLDFHAEYPEEEVLSLRYYCIDFLPDLPGLRKSAEAGCDFCGFLRSAILHRQDINPAQPNGEIQIGLSYVWGNRGSLTTQSGLAGLRAEIRDPSKDSFFPIAFVLFSIWSDDGT